MTPEKLYYDDPYLKHFSAQVVARREIDGRPAIALDRTAFYPGGGGQPCDRGTLNDMPVLDVTESDGQIWHVLAETPWPLHHEIQGVLDWPWRRDLMENHSGQHVLSQAFIRVAEAETVGWHLSPNSVTIDLDQSELDEETLDRAELLANEVLARNFAISARFVDEAELPALQLRKQPDVTGPLRLVEIAGFDRVACGGTHVASTAEIGLIKILRAERRGGETRIHFLCGSRALEDYRRKHRLVRNLASRFSRGEDELLEATDKLQAENQAARKALRSAQDALVDAEAERLWGSARQQPAVRIITGTYDDWEAEQVKRLALALRSRPGCFIALAAGNPPQVTFTRSEDVQADAGRLLRQALEAVGGRGGGRNDYAQGRAPSIEAVGQLFAVLTDLLAAGDS